MGKKKFMEKRELGICRALSTGSYRATI